MRIDADDTAGDAAEPAEPGQRRMRPAEPEEEDGIKPLPDRLLSELTTHRTLALRHAIGEHPDVAFLAALHALCLKLFYPYTQDTCLEIDLRQVAFTAQAPGLSRNHPAKAIQRPPPGLGRGVAARGGRSVGRARGGGRRHAAASVRALRQHRGQWRAGSVEPPAEGAGACRPAGRGGAARHGGRRRGSPTLDTYLGRVTKARILQAVREAKGEPAAERIAHLKKGEMAEQAQDLLAGSGWLPEPLRTPGQAAQPGRGDRCADAVPAEPLWPMPTVKRGPGGGEPAEEPV